MKELDDFLETHLGHGPEAVDEVELFPPWSVIGLLWEGVDAIRPDWPQIATLEYDSRFEPEADRAIIIAASLLSFAPWREISWGAKRVLAERITQMIAVAATNAAVGNEPIMVLPTGLTNIQRGFAAVLRWLLRAQLPRKPARLSALPAFPEGLPEPPQRLQ